MKKAVKVFVMLFFVTGLVFAQENTEKKPAGKISGYMFGDVFYNLGRDDAFSTFKNTAMTGDKEVRGFQMRRIYFTYDNDISETFSARFRLEADQVEMTSKKDKSSKTALFVKDAYLKWKTIFKGSDLIFGIQPTPAYEVSESVWGYRLLEKTIMDLRGIVSSRDLGLSLKGKIDGDGKYNYWVMYGSNSGVNAETDKYNRVYGHIHLKPFKGFQTTLYVDYKQQARIVDPADATETLRNDVLTYSVFAGYGEKDKYNVGAEGFMQSAMNGITSGTDTKSKNAIGFSIFGYYNINPEFSLVARYDYFDPVYDKSSKGDARNYILSGVSWKADKNVSITPNILLETYQKAPGSKAPEVSTTMRVTFFYAFL